MLVRLSTVALAASLLSAASALSSEDIGADIPIAQLLSSAHSLLARGETSDALIYYDAAVARDPSDYLTFFKRATTYLSLGRTSQASQDFQMVLSLRPGFEGAHVQLGRIKQRSADWDGARQEFDLAGKTPECQEILELEAARQAVAAAEAAEKSGVWDECVNHAGTAILVASRAASLREQRSRCRFEKGEVEEGMSDLLHVLNMRPGDVSPHVKISVINFYSLGELEKGQAQIRKCLQSDPDNKICKRVRKEERRIEKVVERVQKAFGKNQPSTGTKHLIPSGDEPGLIQEVKDQVQALREDGTIPAAAPNQLVTRLIGLACQGYYEMKSKKGATWCKEALELDENSLYGLLSQAEQLVTEESFEAAIETLQKAAAAHPDKQQDIINPLIRDAQMKLKRSKTKDYYKVLEVPSDADEKHIKNAYRKMCKRHHPDKAAKEGVTKEAAEKKMQSINEAYEVLSDRELRARFDRGDDPMSNEQQNPFQGQNPFGSQPFMFQQGGGGGGGGQQFKFHFGSGGFGFGG